MGTIKLKMKMCKEGHMAYLWSHSYCKQHWMIRTAKKQIAESKVVGSKSDLLSKWYRKVYDDAGGICAESGRKLEFSNKVCCHLLNKAAYPYFSLDLRNSIVLGWDYHAILDRGSASQRKGLKTWEYISMMRKLLLAEVGEEYSEKYWLNMSV